jgi:hypothetical protein
VLFLTVIALVLLAAILSHGRATRELPMTVGCGRNSSISILVFAHTRGYVPGVFLLLTTLGIQRRASPAAAVTL